MNRTVRTTVVVLGLVSLQVGAWFLYRKIEQQKQDSPLEQAFHYQPARRALPNKNILLQRADGTTLRLGDALSAPMVLHFWATWCVPCAEELPTLLRLADESPNLNFVLVSVDQNWATVRHFFGDSVPALVVLDPRGAAREAYGVTTLPRTYILGRDGVAIADIVGARDWSSSRAKQAVARWAGSPR